MVDFSENLGRNKGEGNLRYLVLKIHCGWVVVKVGVVMLALAVGVRSAAHGEAVVMIRLVIRRNFGRLAWKQKERLDTSPVHFF